MQIDFKKIKYIFFDFTDVIAHRIRGHEEIAADLFQVTPEEFKKINSKVKKLTPGFDKHLFNINSIESQHVFFKEYFKKVFKILNREYSDEWYEQNNKKYFLKEYKLMDWTKHLPVLKKNFKIGLLSNGYPTRRIYDLVEFNISQYFDEVILSFEVGMQKPDKKLFELAIEKSGVRPEEILFIDDNPKFIKGAKKLRINAVIISDWVESVDSFVNLLGNGPKE